MSGINPLTLTDAAGALASGAVTSAALVEASLARAQADASLGAFLDVDAEGARAEAAASDARRAHGAARGPLDGVPIAVKDNLCRAGRPVTAGSRILEGWRAPYDATAVARLRAAGAVIVGGTNLDEFGMGSSTENSAYRVAKNPWDASRVPGGSSGGSAVAVAAGMALGALGSDTGGSVRQPAALCGVVGLKPTYGRVSRFGLIAYASSLDTVGPLARDVRGAALLLDAIAGPCARDATSHAQPHAPCADAPRAASGRTIGVPRALVAGVDDEVAAALARVERALVDAGARIVDVELPQSARALACYYVLAPAEASSNLMRYDGVRYGPRDGEGAGVAGMVEATRARFGAEVKRRIVLGTWVLSAGYHDAYVKHAQRMRARITTELEAALVACDALLMPTSPEPAWPLGAKPDPLSLYKADLFTLPASLAGLPALSVPAGHTSSGLPIGAQLVGRAFDERTLVSVAGALEDALALPVRLPAVMPSSSSAPPASA